MTAVSIILITYNDSARLPRALASLRAQTLHDLEIIVVDDASTDGTPRIVAEAMAEDRRIRSVRLPENSGGCSAPRNAGIQAASGDWVMFCDSDDEFERHAAKNLLLAVEEDDADLGCGVAERIDIHTGKTVRWRADLHDRAALGGILERPALIADTVSVNKIYRRTWLLAHANTFPEGVLYEDQLFTMRAYAQARRISVIPQTVYRWYVERLGSELSITQRRHEVRNARSRIEVNRLIDAFLASDGPSELEPVKRRKFLAHDLYLYLASMLEMDDEQSMAVIDELHPYVSSLNLEAAQTLRPALRVAIAHLLLRDVEGIRAAMRAVTWSATIDMPIVQRGDRDLWGCEHLDTHSGLAGHDMAWWLDVTAYRLRFAGLGRARWCHRLEALSSSADGLSVIGSTIDAFATLAEVEDATVVLMSGERVVAELPTQWSRMPDGRWRWAAQGPLRACTRIADGQSGVLGLRLRYAGAENLGSLRSVRRPRQVTRGVDRAHGLRIEFADHGTIRWRTGFFTRSAKARAAASRLLGAAAAPVRRGWTVLVRSLGGLLGPRNVALLHSVRGRGGQPWAIAQLSTGGSAPAMHWLSELGGTRRAWEVSRARLLITDDIASLPPDVPPRTSVVLAPLGPAIERIGRDSPDWDITPKSARVPRPALARRWSAVLSPNAGLDDRLRSWSGFEGRILHADAVMERARSLRAQATSPEGAAERRHTVLYAPSRAAAIDLAALVDALGDRLELWIRHDDGRAADIPSVLRSTVVDASSEPDLAMLMANADILVSDASPLMWSAAQLAIPTIVHAPDLDRVAMRTGTYLDLRAAGPGPVTSTTAELVAALAAVMDRGCRIDPEWADRVSAIAEAAKPSLSVVEALARLGDA